MIFYVCNDDFTYWSDENCGCGCKPDICKLQPETGLCKAAFTRYYYDADTECCKEFIYGGCGGNDNNFNTQQECETFAEENC